MSRLRYTFETTLQSLWQSPGLSLVTVFTIGAALLVFGAYIAAIQNLEQLALTWGRAATVSAYIDDGVEETQWPSVIEKVRTLPGIKRATVLTPEEALAAFRARGPEAAALVEGIESDILPASVEIELMLEFAGVERVARVATELEALPEIAEVDYGQTEFERLAALVDLLRWIGLVAGVFVIAATAFIVSNTIRLTVFARSDEIEILSLVGATSRFVQAPFLLEGAIWGLAGGLSAALVLMLGDILVAPQLSHAMSDVLGGIELFFFTATLGGILVTAGVLLGVLGSFLAVARFLFSQSPT